MANTKPAPTNEKIAKSKNTILGWLVSLIFAVLLIAVAPTAIILIIGLLPTLVALFLDGSRERMAGVAVGATNFAGTLPALLQLWRSSNDMTYALNLVTNPYVLLLMYSGAAIGWVIYWQVPPFFGQIMRRRAQAYLKNLDDKQLDLITEWGPEVMGTKESEAKD